MGTLELELSGRVSEKPGNKWSWTSRIQYRGALIGVSVVAVVALILASAWFCWKKRENSSLRKKPPTWYRFPSPEIRSKERVHCGSSLQLRVKKDLSNLFKSEEKSWSQVKKNMKQKSLRKRSVDAKPNLRRKKRCKINKNNLALTLPIRHLTVVLTFEYLKVVVRFCLSYNMYKGKLGIAVSSGCVCHFWKPI